MCCGHSKKALGTPEVVRLLFLLFLFCWVESQAQTTTLWSKLRIASDASASWTPEQAWVHTQRPEALRLQHAHQVVGAANSPPHWAAFTLDRTDFEEQALWLSLQSPTQDHSALWVRYGDGDWEFQPEVSAQNQGVGEGYLMATWSLKSRDAPRLDVLLRIQGPNRVQFPLSAQSTVQYHQKQQRLMLFIGAVLALPCTVMFYALTLIRHLKNPQLPLFLGMALTELIAAMWVSGMLSLLWPMLSRFQAAWIGSICYWLLFVLSVFHAQSFLNTRQTNKLVHRQLQGLAVLWVCVVPCCALLRPELLRSVLLWGGTGHTLYMLRLAWLQSGHASARSQNLYLGVWVVYASSVLVYWMYRWFEWPLLTTLGVQFVQGAVVSTLLGLAASIQVIGEREQLAQGLLMSQARARWYAAAQHDLWQPLQSIQLYSQALLKAPSSQKPKLVNGLKLASQSVDDFMNHLRFFAEGAVPTVSKRHQQTVCIHDVLQPLVDEFRPLAQMRHLVLRYRPSQETVLIDPISVQRMVRNLLNNAIHYTPAGGRVLIACQRRGQVLWLLCIDNGMGMTPSQLKDCFEPFTRFDLTGEGINKLGLGLFSVKQQALQYQMPTRLQSVQGRGTLVGFGMPLMNKPVTV